jgi:pimeloyl-ACP methyl ester carboxylesterase
VKDGSGLKLYLKHRNNNFSMKLFFRKVGEGKTTLIILHGLFGLSDNWNTIGKILSHSFRVYLVDLRNHGNSPHSNEWTYPAMVNDIRELVNDEKLDKVNLLGHSLGGKVAMQFAAMYSEKIKKLIVVDMAPKSYSEKLFDFVEKLLQINLAEIKSRKEVEIELRKIIKDEATVQLLLKNIQWNEEQHLSWKFNLKTIVENWYKVGTTFGIKENILVPALFIRGEKSNYILDSDIPQIKTYFPNSTIKTIAGAGHWVHTDKPEDFMQTVREFINE